MHCLICKFHVNFCLLTHSLKGSNFCRMEIVSRQCCFYMAMLTLHLLLWRHLFLGSLSVESFSVSDYHPCRAALTHQGAILYYSHDLVLKSVSQKSALKSKVSQHALLLGFSCFWCSSKVLSQDRTSDPPTPSTHVYYYNQNLPGLYWMWYRDWYSDHHTIFFF